MQERAHTDSNVFKCEYCGKFISYREMDLGLATVTNFTPDSHFTIEKTEYAHTDCINNAKK